MKTAETANAFESTFVEKNNTLEELLQRGRQLNLDNEKLKASMVEACLAKIPDSIRSHVNSKNMSIQLELVSGLFWAEFFVPGMTRIVLSSILPFEKSPRGFMDPNSTWFCYSRNTQVQYPIGQSKSLEEILFLASEEKKKEQTGVNV